MIKVICYKCKNELSEQGGILLSPPDKEGRVYKSHICKDCFMEFKYSQYKGEEIMGGAICGGVMSFSQSKRLMKKEGIWAGMMSFLMPDKQYNKWLTYKKQKKEKQAQALFDKYAISQI